MSAVELAVLALATWRLSALFYSDSGPWDVFTRLRTRAGVYEPPERRGFWAKQLACFWCVSLYAGLACAVVGWFWWWLLLPLALSGAAVLLSGGGRILWREMVEN